MWSTASILRCLAIAVLKRPAVKETFFTRPQHANIAAWPVGILSSRDFQAYVVEGLERIIDRARYEEALDEGYDPHDHLGGSYGR